MSKAVMLSIRPKWCEKIDSGEKTIEVRKTKPKLDTPFKCYIYETQGWWERDGIMAFRLGGHVIGEFTCDRIDRLAPANEPYGVYDIDDDYVFQTCLENGALWDYGHGTPLYGWHISGLKIYDMPKKLIEFSPVCRYKNDDKSCQSRRVACSYQKYDYNPDGSINLVGCGRTLERPPQSWCYVEVMDNG